MSPNSLLETKTINMKEADICIIGAGFGGLCASIQLQNQLGTSNFIVFDRNKDVGGCWYSNTYPGCGCDISGHLYSLSFAQKPDWKSIFPSQPELLEYLQGVAREFGIYPKIRFNTEVQSLNWEDERGKWRVIVRNVESHERNEYYFKYVISAMGNFHTLHYPESLMKFSGPIIHTGNWDDSVPLDDKRVAVVGCGASGVQVLPHVVEKAKSVVSYQRNPSWVIPRFDWKVPKFIQCIFQIPLFLWFVRVVLYWYHEFLHTALERGTGLAPIGSSIVGVLTGSLKTVQLRGFSSLAQKIDPRDIFGCRRFTASNDYYPALANPKVNVVTSPIAEVHGNSITTENGETSDVDVLILATGFKVQDFFSHVEIKGTDGIDISSKWKTQGPDGYLGIFFEHLPNCFFIMGPRTDNGHNSSILTIENAVNAIIKVIAHSETSKCRSVVVKHSTVERYMGKYWTELKNSVYLDDQCAGKSYYYEPKNKKVTTLFYWNQTEYWKATNGVAIDEFEYI